MRVFLSWSGDMSRQMASILIDILPEIVQGIHPWMSEQSLELGKNWRTELINELKEARFGLLCLTRHNLLSPWLIFEAGILASNGSTTRIVPYRLNNFSIGEVPPPISDFEGTSSTKEGTWELVNSLNDSLQNGTEISLLTRRFEKWWPELNDKFTKLSQTPERHIRRTDRSILEEILNRLPPKDADRGSSILRTLESRQLDLEGRAHKTWQFLNDANQHGADVPADYRQSNEIRQKSLLQAANDYQSLIKEIERLEKMNL